jgi:hypothetical protein
MRVVRLALHPSSHHEATVCLSVISHRINRQGGTGKITAIHENGHLDIKYILCGFDKNLPPHLVAPHAVLERTTRRRQPQPRGGTAAIVEVESMPEDGSSTNDVDEMRAGKPAAQRKVQLVKKTTKRSKKLKKAAAAASSVRSTPSACSSTGSSIVTYVPKEIAVPVVAHRNGEDAMTQDKNPPLFSPLTVAGDNGAVRKKKPITTMASSSSSSSSAGAGPPSVIEECYMSDDNEPSALGRTSTATTPNTDGPSAMMLDSPRNDKNDAPIEDEFSTTKAPYCTKNKLRGVFEDDRKTASQFIESVVESSQDLNRFSSLLNQALLQNDGALDLADLGQYVADDRGGGPAYSDDQIQHFLQHLCAQNKIMRSDDNVIYSM